jgi:hypothetical protein
MILHLVILSVERPRLLPSVERANTLEFLLIKVYKEEFGTLQESSRVDDLPIELTLAS